MKHLTALLVFTAIATTTLGQPLYPYPQPDLLQGDIYHGDFTNPGEHNAAIKLNGDTVISLVTYSYFPNEYFPDYYTRYDSGKVYYVSRNIDGSLTGSEYLLYDFTLVVNDTFPSYNYGDMVVDSVSTILLINGQTRKYMELGDQLNKTHRWIDGIGDIDMGFLYAWDFEGGYERFTCHRDSTGMVYINSANNDIWDCDSITGYIPIGIENLTQTIDFKISPNPATDIITITGNNLQSVELFNSIGQIIGNRQFGNRSTITLDLSFFTKGLYLIKVSDGKRARIEKIIKQ